MRRVPLSSSVLALAFLAASCEGPKYATFEPLREDVAVDRVQREHFSMPVPKGWFVGDDDRALTARETPPKNGQLLVYRKVVVQPVAAIAGDDEATQSANALAFLRARLDKEDFAELASGNAELAGRASPWLRGTMQGGSLDTRLDVLAYVVPARDAALYVEFSTPEGQFDAAQPGFAALARGFETDFQPPRGSGPVEWLADGKVGLSVDDWKVARDVDGCDAVLTREGSAVRGELQVKLRALPFDLDAFVDDYVVEHASTRSDLVVQSVERGRRELRAFALVRSVWRDGARTVVGLEVVAVAEGRFERLLFTAPAGEWRAVEAEVEAVVRSMRAR